MTTVLQVQHLHEAVGTCGEVRRDGNAAGRALHTWRDRERGKIEERERSGGQRLDPRRWRRIMTEVVNELFDLLGVAEDVDDYAACCVGHLSRHPAVVGHPIDPWAEPDTLDDATHFDPPSVFSHDLR